MMIDFLKRIIQETKLPSLAESDPLRVFWTGASWGLILFSTALVLWAATHADYGIGSLPVMAIAVGICVVSIFAFRWLSNLVLHSALALPRFFFGAFGSAIGLLLVLRNFRFWVPEDYFYYGGFLLLWSFALIFGLITVLAKGKFGALSSGVKASIALFSLLGAVFIGYSGYWIFREGTDPYPSDFEQIPLVNPISDTLDDPAQPGSYSFTKWTYSSGVNNQRPEYAEGIKYKSETVDGSYILPQWKGKNGSERERYWGFGLKEWPLAGTVWMPDGDGPFPMVLIVHGNHSMTDYSDPGYAYLGELLASRGYITISVDENFINGAWSGDFRGRELPARAWLLLKHLQQWEKWSADASHELYEKADLDNVVLIGHSRGGEAVPIAAAFNTLPYFPDDAREKFDFNFGIKGVVAIAPTDYRYDRRVVIENVDFLGLQGSYDSDEDSFFGLRQLDRTQFTDSAFHVKAGLYIHGGNHGQFNTGWGRHDSGFPGKYFLNTEPMISGELQRAYGKLMIAAFLDVSVKGKKDYLPVLQDIRHAAGWLPEKTITMSIYEDSNTRILADYEGDINIETTNVGKASSQDLTFWGEDFLQYRGGRDQDDNATILGWQADSISKSGTYQITLDTAMDFSGASALRMGLSMGDPSMLKDAKEDSMVYDFTIQLQDSSGNVAKLNPLTIKKLVPRLKIRYLKTKALTVGRYRDEWEPVLETFILPFEQFDNIQAINLAAINSIRLEFPGDQTGIIIIDDLGLQPM